MSDGTEPIGDEEFLYRRIPLIPEYFNPGIALYPTPKAFRPRQSDQNGLSVSRARYCTPAQLARNDRGRQYYVAVLKASDLRAHGIEVVPDPLPGHPGHSLLPTLNYENRKTDRSEEVQVLLALQLCIRVEGPFAAD